VMLAVSLDCPFVLGANLNIAYETAVYLTFCCLVCRARFEVFSSLVKSHFSWALLIRSLEAVKKS
jgi:hypothetical protein